MAQPRNRIRDFKKIGSAVFFAILTSAVICNICNASEKTAWQKIPTEHAVILFQDNADLSAFDARIRFKTNGPAKDLNTRIVRKVDGLFVRAQALLGMKGFVNPIVIKIFKDSHQLDQAYRNLYREKGQARAWYAHDTLTIYLQLNDLNEGMLAHEFAHAIIDHYLIVPPPTESAEILARYVDRNLKKEMTPSGSKGQILGYSK